MSGTVEALGPERARRAAKVWTFRTRVEREASLRFASVADRLAGGRAPQVVVEMARAAAEDEVRHANLCAELALRFDSATATAELAKMETRAAPEDPPSSATARERLLLEVVAMSCITETLSTALLGEMHARASDGRVRDVVHEVLRDEIQHSRLGWAYLAAEHARGPVGFLGDYLPVLLAGTVTEEIFRPIEAEGDSEDAVLGGHGALPRSSRLAIFADTMHGVVFPGLARFGVGTAAGERWMQERMAGSP